MNHKEFSFSSINNQKIYSQEWRPEHEVLGVIALVHGLGEHSGRYQHVADFFTRKGFALVSFDLYGHGNSGGKHGHMPSEETYLLSIDELLQFIRKDFPAKPIYLYGHSMGGEIVLWYSLLRKPKVNGVIAASPFLASCMPENPFKLFAARIMNNIYPSFSLDSGLDRNALSKDISVIKAYNNDPLVHGFISARLGWTLVEIGDWLLQHADEFPVPILLMVGSEESIVNVEKITQFAKSVPKERLEFKVWEGLYHELHNEPEKKLVLDYELDWMKQHFK